MASILRVNTIQNNAGSVSIPVMAGGIIQVKYAQKTDTGTVSLSAVTDTVIHTDLQVTITPTSANSLIKLEGQIFGEHGVAANNYSHVVFFYRDTTKLAAPTEGSRLSGVGIMTRTYEEANADSTPEFAHFAYFDSPSSTSAITYKLGILVRDAETFYINRTVSDANVNYSERGTSFICVTEIAQ